MSEQLTEAEQEALLASIEEQPLPGRQESLPCACCGELTTDAASGLCVGCREMARQTCSQSPAIQAIEGRAAEPSTLHVKQVGSGEHQHHAGSTIHFCDAGAVTYFLCPVNCGNYSLMLDTHKAGFHGVFNREQLVALGELISGFLAEHAEAEPKGAA